MPLQQKGADQDVVTQMQMGDVVELGLLKMDFLGLRNLDVIDAAVELIGGGLDIEAIPLDDALTYRMLADGDAVGVFQFESSGMREALRQVKPTEFEDLIALVALYRPGPMQYIPEYAKRKNGQAPVTFIDERLKAITGDTYGTCLTGDTLVFDAASGRRIRIEELRDHDDVLVQGVDQDYASAHARVTAWVDNGVKPVFRLRLKNGATIKATGDHQFLTEDGWRRLEELASGSFIGTPQKLDSATEGRCLSPRERARFKTLAYLLADGSLCTATPPSFYSSSPALLNDFESACTTGFDDIALSRYEQERGVVRISAGRDRERAGGYHAASSLEQWLRDEGLRWKLRDPLAAGTSRRGPRSEEKWIPECVFELSDEDIARFVAALWDCDGHVGGREVFYTTISERLAHDVQALLLRLGIRSAIRRSPYEDGRGRLKCGYQVRAIRDRPVCGAGSALAGHREARRPDDRRRPWIDDRSRDCTG